jgi:hypothetical protein
MAKNNVLSRYGILVINFYFAGFAVEIRTSVTELQEDITKNKKALTRFMPDTHEDVYSFRQYNEEDDLKAFYDI